MNDTYRILHTIATGGTAVLYKAIQTSLDRPVVIKRLHAHLVADSDFARRFRCEAKAAASLDHENIVRIIDFGTDRDGRFIVMEYIDGPSLKEVLASKRVLGGELTMLLAHQICLGLDHAHRRGVIHRDIKPANILIGIDGRIKITDFGLAKLHRPDTQETVASTLLGTPLYMSPEQAAGEALDGRSDLFSLGTICYEALTGTQPFCGDSYAAVIQRILHGTVMEPSRSRNDIPPGIEGIVMKSLSREPAKRFADAREMARAVESVLGRESVLTARDRIARLAAGRDETIRAVERPIRKRKRRTSLSLSIAAGAMTAFALIAIQSGIIRMLPPSIRAMGADPVPANPDPVIAAHGEPTPGIMMTPIRESPISATSLRLLDPLPEPLLEPAAESARDADTTMADTSSQAAYECSPASEPHPESDTTSAPPIAAQSIAAAPEENEAESCEPPAVEKSVAPAASSARFDRGFLDIAVEPAASISIDGNPQTATGRLTMLELPTGAHTIRCRAGGYYEYAETIRIVKGELSRRRIVLREIMGSLSIVSERGARLYVDGVYRGMLPLSEPVPLSIGKHRIELRKAGMRPWSTTVFVPAEETLRLTIALVSLSVGQ